MIRNESGEKIAPLRGMTSVHELTNENITDNLRALKAREDHIIADVLEYIGEMERRELHLALGYSTVYSYLSQCLGYSESEAYRRIEAARLMGRVPESKSELISGNLTMTNMAEVQKALRVYHKTSGQQPTDDFRRRLLDDVKGCSRKEAQRRLVAMVPELGVAREESCRELSDGSLEVILTFKPEERIGLEKARDLLAHTGPISSYGELINKLCEFYLRKKDLTQGFDAREGRTSIKTHEVTHRIPIRLRRSIFKRDSGRCQFVGINGRRCLSSYEVEIDHIVPVSAGGPTSYDNLRCVCRSHNQWKSNRLI